MSEKRVVYVRHSNATAAQVRKAVEGFSDYLHGTYPQQKPEIVDADNDLPVWDFGRRRGTIIAHRELDEGRTLLGYSLPGDNRCFILGHLDDAIDRWHIGEWRQWATAAERERMRR